MIDRNSKHIHIEGYTGTWYVIDSSTYMGNTCYLLEHEQHGDETVCLWVYSSGKVILETWDGEIGLWEHEEERNWLASQPR